MKNRFKLLVLFGALIGLRQATFAMDISQLLNPEPTENTTEAMNTTQTVRPVSFAMPETAKEPTPPKTPLAVVALGHVFSCAYCGSYFFNDFDLLEHRVTTHIDLRPYRCILCDYITDNRLAALHHYLKTHTGERKYICTYEACGFTADQLTSMKKHIKEYHLNAKYHYL
jgi:hypothetical protein